MGERHVAESNWRHMSQPDWSAYVIAYTCEAACVIAYTCEAACVIAYTCEVLVSSLTRARFLCHRLHVLRCDWFLHDTWQISVGF